jgi:putative SOS response-associated peptidase YedK
MCGRFVQIGPGTLAKKLGAEAPTGLSPRYNLAPSQDVMIVRASGTSREVALARWGLVPGWTADPHLSLAPINARSETADLKPTFREALRKRRCVLPAEGFFEWKREGRRRQPYFIRRRDREPLYMAGLWESWISSEDGREIETTAILTTKANDLLVELHERMPVLLQADGVTLWLDESVTNPKCFLPLYVSFPAELLVVEPVSDRVNSVKYDDAKCLEVVSEPATTGSLFDE